MKSQDHNMISEIFSMIFKPEMKISAMLDETICNKHCEILVSCSDKERNCMQAHVTACKVIELHARSWNCMQAHVNACKLM